MEKINICINCGGPCSDCKLCSRCNIAHYCSKECQKEHFPSHKETCKELKSLHKKVMRLEEPLHHNQDWGGNIEDLFETNIGHFWGLLDPRDYCRARAAYAEKLRQAGIKDDNKFAYETGLSHYLELLRLTHSDNQGIRSYVPFVLLVLNRLEDCYGFIKWWATIDPNGNYDWGDAPFYEEGDWAYLKDQDIMEDLFLDERVGDAKYFDSCHLLALILMKIMLIRRIEETVMGEWKTFLLGTDEVYGKDSHVLKIANNMPVIDMIHNYLKVSSGLSSQEALFQKYCKLLDDINPRILKAIAFPDPLMSQPAPHYYSPDSANGAYEVVSCGLYAFQDTGARQKIIEKYGRRPCYDHKIELEHSW
eukprot:Seg1646.14 transcript_id=Seg1646.14/GoldUCD/mRNA.D3Y31 product="Ankyrin repeat and MYND domain-containing protein 2" protein_id=Seg1646.14/GoldUCD/D3Y31